MEREGEDRGKDRAVWSEEDEIVVLQGIIDFAIDKNKSFSQHKTPFHNFVKRSLVPLRPTPYQLSEKIRTLRRKFIMTGKTTFSKPHDLECLELCKRIWQSDGTPFEACAISSNKNDSESFLYTFLIPSIAGLGLDEDLYIRGWCMVPVNDKKELEDKYRLFQSEALEVFMQRQQLSYEIASAILAARSSN